MAHLCALALLWALAAPAVLVITVVLLAGWAYTASIDGKREITGTDAGWF